jgi:flagellar FliL protein
MANEKAEKPTKGSGTRMIWPLFLACALVALAAGAALPYFFLHAPAQDHNGTQDGPHARNSLTKHAYVPFGELIVNLNEERLTRYLKVKLLLVSDAREEKALGDLVQKKKPLLRNWLIAHLSDKSLQEISGAAGMNKLRREIWHQFNAELYPDGSEKILDIFFEEFVVQ